MSIGFAYVWFYKGGSSAGGNLAAAVTHHLHNENRKLAGQVGCLKKKNVDVLLQLMKWPPTQTF